MKLTPQMQLAAERMAPGVITRDGLLGSDSRPLPEILDADNAAVLNLGLTHAAIAARMEALTQAAASGFGEPVTLEEKYLVRLDEFPGPMTCPFGGCEALRKNVTTVRRLSDGQEMRWSALGRHMIASHGFYQGLGSEWRLDPAELARFLGLAQR